MKLHDLNARLTKVRRAPVDPTAFVDGVLSPSGMRDYYDDVSALAEADGIWFDCPCARCRASEYPTRVLIGFEGRALPDTYSKGSDGRDTRWKITGGSGLDDLQLAPSIKITGGCNWHGFVGNHGVPAGEAR